MFARLAILFSFGLTSLSIVADESTEVEKGFIPLFDGKSIDDWVQRGGVAKYEVVDGTILGTAVPKTPNSFLCTPRDYSDFELRLEFKVHPHLNSGIMFRAQSNPEYRKGVVHGYQAEIDPSARAWTGGIYDEARRGWINDLKNNEAARKAFKQGEWNEYRIRCKGDSIKTWLNGVPAADLKDDKDASGFIGLQVHGIGGKEVDPNDPRIVAWRNIRIKELK